MFKRLQGLFVGIVIGVTISGAMVFAAASNTTLQAIYHNIKIIVDGAEIVPKDAAGNTVEPFIVNGTTYLPVRAVATALGKEVYWDGPNYTVYLGAMGGKLEYPTMKLGDATNIGDEELSEEAKRTDNYGNTYSTAYYAEKFETLLNMKYSRFKATIFNPQGYSKNSIMTILIELDGKIIYTSPDFSKTSAPVKIDVNITGGNDFKIIYKAVDLDGFSDWIGPLGDAGFYQ